MIVLSEKNFPTIEHIQNDFNTLPVSEEDFYDMNLVNLPESGEEPIEDIEEYFL